MKSIQSYLFTVFAGLLALTSFSAQARSITNSVTAIGGYDVISYHTDKRPLRGNGRYLAVHDDVTCLFSSKENQATFEANPAKYVPAFGGYCAFGASVGKKFVGEPDSGAESLIIREDGWPKGVTKYYDNLEPVMNRDELNIHT